MKKYARDWLESLYRSAFRLVYAHDGHVTRVIFVFLNIWWLLVTLVPSVVQGDNALWYGRTAILAIAICSVNVLNGFFLLLFRENEVFISLHYLTTMLLAVSSALYSLKDGIPDTEFGAMIAIAFLCALSYVRYVIQSGNSAGVMMTKALIDVQQAHKLMPIELKNGENPYANRMDTR
jgi:hypothetical protein